MQNTKEQSKIILQKTIEKNTLKIEDIEKFYINNNHHSKYGLEYERLSSGYNAGDLAIGKNVDYVSVLLNANAS